MPVSTDYRDEISIEERARPHFNLKPDSTALKAGFSPLPLVRMLAES